MHMRSTSQIIRCIFREGWSNVLTLLFLNMLKWLQILPSICWVSLPGSSKDKIVSLDMLSKQTSVIF